MSRLKTFRRIWAVTGSVLLVAFILWMAIAYRPNSRARAALESDGRVVVTAEETAWRFMPAVDPPRCTGLLFFPGALVDERAYATLAREAAAAGYPALIVSVPWRGAFGTADRPAVRGRARRLMAAETDVDTWVVAGHSRGAKIAALFVRDGVQDVGGLVLIGSVHPRDFSLADLEIPVAKVYGTNDGVARMTDVLAHRDLLPPTTTWVEVEGGNHGQFASYGFQPLDRFADISREDQRALTVAAIKQVLASVEVSC